MSDKTLFEQWWLELHGPHWKGYISQFEHDNCQSAWNAAIDAAISKCQQVKEKHWQTSAQSPDSSGECKKEILKLKSESIYAWNSRKTR